EVQARALRCLRQEVVIGCDGALGRRRLQRLDREHGARRDDRSVEDAADGTAVGMRGTAVMRVILERTQPEPAEEHEYETESEPSAHSTAFGTTGRRAWRRSASTPTLGLRFGERQAQERRRAA